MQYTMVQAASVWRRKFVRRVSCFSGVGGGKTRCTGPPPPFSWKKAGAKFRTAASSISLEICARIGDNSFLGMGLGPAARPHFLKMTLVYDK